MFYHMNGQDVEVIEKSVSDGCFLNKLSLEFIFKMEDHGSYKKYLYCVEEAVPEYTQIGMRLLWCELIVPMVL